MMRCIGNTLVLPKYGKISERRAKLKIKDILKNNKSYERINYSKF